MTDLKRQAEKDLDALCRTIGERRAGSEANRRATRLFEDRARALGWRVEAPEIDCLDWEDGAVGLQAGGRDWPARPSFYSPGCEVRAELAVAATVEEVEASEIGGKVLLLRGPIAAEPMMPKDYPFYYPDEHRRIIESLEAAAPAAIVAATGACAALAGGLSPFPMFMDGNFDIPSVYMEEGPGCELAKLAGSESRLASAARRRPSRCSNVSAARGDIGASRIVFCAHIDTHFATPGALDNGGGIVTLLALLELLKGYRGSPAVEILALNGHEHFAAPGAMAYLAGRKAGLADVALAVNLDGAGHRGQNTAFSLYACPEGLERTLRGFFAGRPGFGPGEPWPQSDHMIFAMAGRPAVALTSADLIGLEQNVTHTKRDVPGLVDIEALIGIGRTLADLPALVDSVGP